MSEPSASKEMQNAPTLAGVHHLKLPVRDLARSRQWYRSRLGYEVTVEFVEQGKLMGYVLHHRAAHRLACPGRYQRGRLSRRWR